MGGTEFSLIFLSKSMGPNLVSFLFSDTLSGESGAEEVIRYCVDKAETDRAGSFYGGTSASLSCGTSQVSSHSQVRFSRSREIL